MHFFHRHLALAPCPRRGVAVCCSSNSPQAVPIAAWAQPGQRSDCPKSLDYPWKPHGKGIWTSGSFTGFPVGSSLFHALTYLIIMKSIARSLPQASFGSAYTTCQVGRLGPNTLRRMTIADGSLSTIHSRDPGAGAQMETAISNTFMLSASWRRDIWYCFADTTPGWLNDIVVPRCSFLTFSCLGPRSSHTLLRGTCRNDVPKSSQGLRC